MTREDLIRQLEYVVRMRVSYSDSDDVHEQLLFDMFTAEERRLRKLLGWGRNRP